MKYTIKININEDVASELKKHELKGNPYSLFELNVIACSVMEELKECLNNLQKQIKKEKLIIKRAKKGE